MAIPLLDARHPIYGIQKVHAAEWLHQAAPLQLFLRRHVPIRARKHNVAIEPCHGIAMIGQCLQRDIQQSLFLPEHRLPRS